MDTLSFLRSRFDTVSQDYNLIRPKYPDGLFDDILTYSGCQPGAFCLEIGCGTGQATLPFAQRGLNIHCLDIGADLIKLARDNLVSFPGVTFEQAAFEDWVPDGKPYDLLFSATAFHWVPLEIGYRKAGEVLCPAGTLALFWNRNIYVDQGFCVEVDELYRKYNPAYVEPSQRKTLQKRTDNTANLIEATGLFGPVDVSKYSFRVEYSAAEYIRLINTYSDHLAIPERERYALYSAIGDLIDCSYQGSVEKEYETALFIARRGSR